MATRYWVGGSGTWDSSTTTHWSTTSNGSSGASAPTSTDDVVFDANSITSVSRNISISTGAVCAGIDTTAVTSIPSMQIASGTTLSIYGNVALSSNTSMIALGSTGIDVYSSSATFMSNTTMNANITIKTGASITLSTRNLNVFSNYLLRIDGSLNTNNLSFGGAGNNISVYGTLTAGTSTVTAGQWYADSASTLSVASASFVINGFGTQSFNGGGKTYNNVTFSGVAISSVSSFTAANLTINQDAVITFTAGTTTTVTSGITLTGVSAHKITLGSSSPGSQWTISKSSGTVMGNYLILQDSAATGGATFNATSSTDNGNNTGWIFGSIAAYSRDSLSTLPTTSTDLATVYSSGEVTTVSNPSNTTPVDELGNKTYLLHQFKFAVANNTDPLTPIWIGKTTRPATASPVVMQVWNNTSSTWSTLTSNTTATAGTTFTLTATQSSSISSYVDGSNLVYVRIYQ